MNKEQRQRKKRDAARARSAQQREREKRAAALKRRFVPAKKANGKVIQRWLAASGKDPNDYKNWVIIQPGQISDWRRREPLIIDGVPLDISNGDVVLSHKGELHKILPQDIADRWWRRGLGIRVNDVRA